MVANHQADHTQLTCHYHTSFQQQGHINLQLNHSEQQLIGTLWLERVCVRCILYIDTAIINSGALSKNYISIVLKICWRQSQLIKAPQTMVLGFINEIQYFV